MLHHENFFNKDFISFAKNKFIDSSIESFMGSTYDKLTIYADDILLYISNL